jgi:hypothetical protein
VVENSTFSTFGSKVKGVLEGCKNNYVASVGFSEG